MIRSVPGRLLSSRAVGVSLTFAVLTVGADPFLANRASVALSGQAPSTAPATELQIRVRPPVDHTGPVRLKKAQLLLAWWGSTEEVPLRHRYVAGELVVTVPLGSEVLSSLDAAPPPDFAYVYLEFDGFVPVRSEQFHWLGGTMRPDPPGKWEKVTAVQFRFRGGPTVRVPEGQRREVSLQARRPVSKQVRFVDTRGRPFTGITVDGGAFWSNANHCGYPGGQIPLFTKRRPDAHGILPVPDGDFEYGFRVEGNHHASIIGGEDHDPTFLTAFIDEPELLVRIKRHRRVPLNVRVSIGGTPAAGVIVGGSRRWGCMNATGPFGRTDDRGVLRVPDFYPEEYEGICIGGPDGRPVWSVGDPKRGDFTIDLPAGTKVGEIVYCYAPDSTGGGR